MITPSFSLTATERVLPKLALDFTTASLDPRVTFTRTTDATHPATYVNSSGYITAAADNAPRFDYDPIALTCKGLLIEESRTNSLTYSEQFNNARWTVNGASVSPNATTSPANDLTADKIVEDSSTGVHRLIPTVGDPNVNGQWSVYAKAAGRTQILIFDAVASKGYGFNLSNGTMFAVSGITSVSTPFIVSMGNGWYRCGINTPVSTNVNVYLMSNATTISYQGDGTSGVYLWGAQLEAGAFATSYIPTTSAALTRNADVATMTGTNFSSWWTATTGSANVLVIPKSAIGIKPLFQLDDNSADNIISLRGNAANPELYIKATTDQSQIDAGTIVANTAYKLAGAWNTNNCAASQNGVAAVTDTSATIPTVTQSRIGSDGTNYANAWLQKINYWPQRITNNETQAFSK